MWRYASVVVTVFLLTSQHASAQSIEFFVGGGSSRYAVQIGGNSEVVTIIPARRSEYSYDANNEPQPLNYGLLLDLIGIGLGLGVICILLIVSAFAFLYHLICWGLQLRQNFVT
jgi:hypothetical protein